MNQKSTTNGLNNDEVTLNTKADDYKNLITRLKDISVSISLLKKKFIDRL